MSLAKEEFEINTGPITAEEVTTTIKRLKAGQKKAPGEDRVSAEMLKAQHRETPKLSMQNTTKPLGEQRGMEDSSRNCQATKERRPMHV